MLPLVLAAALLGQALTPEESARLFDVALDLSEEDGGELWGRELFGPMLLLDARAGRMFANEPDPGGRLAESGVVFTGPLPAEIGLSNSAQDWSGAHWTTLVAPFPRETAELRRLLAHELFHRIQPELGLVAASPPNPHLDTLEGRTWLRLEWRALAAALSEEGEAQGRALEDALLFREHRRSLFPEAAESEDGLERNEGLAESTGWRCSGLSAPEAARAIADRLLAEESGDAFGRSFAYVSGPAWAALLDQGPDPAWRLALLGAGASRPGLAALVATARGVSPDAREVDARAANYGLEAVRADERARDERRREEIAGWRRRFVDGPVLAIRELEGMNYTFDPLDVRTFPEHGQVYPAIVISAPWGKLTVDSGGALFVMEGSTTREVRVAAPRGPEAAREGDGWRLELSQGWTLERGQRVGDWLVVRG